MLLQNLNHWLLPFALCMTFNLWSFCPLVLLLGLAPMPWVCICTTRASQPMKFEVGVLWSPVSRCYMLMKSCWLFSQCRQLDSKETDLANISTGCSKSSSGQEWASSRNVGKISFFAIKFSTREQSATFHDHRSNWEFIWSATYSTDTHSKC